LEAIEFLWSHSQGILFGDTGSGKTEIYIELIRRTLQKGQSALFLLPEIAITSQMEQRLKSHFPQLAVWHSKIPPRRREEIIKGVATGEIGVVIGARSGIFLPFPNLGLIVVDEFHDDSYKSDKIPKYNGKELALYLGKVVGARVVLGSATPGVTDYYKLPHFRLKGTFFPSEKRRSFISSGVGEELFRKIESHLKKGKQVIIFLPTRGNFKYFICNRCGESIKCPDCDIAMSFHRKERLLKCHYCGKTSPIPSHCPLCGGEEFLTRRMGTKELVTKLEERFPEVKVARMDRDIITSKKRLDKLIGEFERGEIDILVGTQMVAKGHNFHNVGLSVVLDIDFILGSPDYRAGERAFNLVKQVEGRSGRRGFGEVVIETRNPAFFDREWEEFYAEEIEVREMLGYPPFGRLIQIEFKDKTPEKAEEEFHRVLKCLREEILPSISSNSSSFVEILSQGPAPVFKLGGYYRYQILLKGRNLHSLLLPCLQPTGKRNFAVDVNPTMVI
jgi:primosomal protein N' (replication factor Y)